jgi:4-aminobutyrate aminotransferase-like enzyme/Ser/Thr protein kinase RdoA (MazF antagonist)
MLALSTSAPTFAAAEATRIARECYGLVVESSALPGERDCNFHVRSRDGREFVLKILDPNAPAAATDCQIEVLRHLAEQDAALPVQRLLPTAEGRSLGHVERDGRTYAICLMAYLPGRLLTRIRPSEELLESLGSTLARLDRALQGFFHPALAPHLAWDVRRLPELAEHLSLVPSAAIRARLEKVIAELALRMRALRGLRSQAIHGDCHGSNLLVDPAETSITGILDFGDMLHGPRILEPAVAISELLTEDLMALAGAGALLKGYAGESPLEAEELEVLYDLIAARHAVTILVHAYRSRHDPTGALILEASSVHAARSLEELARVGRDALTRTWKQAGRSGDPRRARAAPDPQRIDLPRRHRLLGAGAELFYEQPLHLVRGRGVILYDAAGRDYLDVYNNVPHVGHAHPVVVEAIQRQVATLATHTRYLHGAILEYAERLTATLPPELDTCMFVNSGSEANDVAWRLAKLATQQAGGLVLEEAYHGITDAVAALTPSGGRPRDPRVATLPLPPAHLRAGDKLPPAALDSAILGTDEALELLESRGLRPAACYIDSALTSSGILDPPPEWARALVTRVRAAGALIVADEVQYGLGRSGSHFWGFARRGIAPDIVTLGKPVGNGYPMGVVIARRSLVEAFQAKYGFFSTFGGNAVAAAAGLAVLEVLEREQLMANARATGEYLRERLDSLAARQPLFGPVRGAGLMLGLEIRATDVRSGRENAKFLINHMAAESRVLIGSEGPNGDVLKLRPPLPFGIEHAQRLIAAIEAAAGALAARSPHTSRSSSGTI